MLNENVTTVLQSINAITNKVVLKHPITIANSPAGDVLIKLNLTELDPEPFEEIGIYELTEFLSTFKLFTPERKVVISDLIINVTEGATALQYISTKPALMENFNKDDKAFVKTYETPTVAEFQLSEDNLKQLKQAAGVFKDLTEIVFISQDGNMNITLGASNKFNAKSNTFSTNVPAETSKEFDVKVPVENFNSLPNSDYTVQVKYNAAKNAYRVLLKSNDIDMEVLIAVKK